ncbi:MAG: hypothetical protein ABSD40_09785 [Streptosporangiaceae bacterium]
MANCAAWLASGGMARERKSATTPTMASSTSSTAAQRGMRRRTRALTAGSSPAAMNRARPMRTSTDRARMISSKMP